MKNKILLGLLLLIALSDLTLQAQEPEKETDRDSLEYHWERFSVSLGGFLAGVKSDISISGSETGLGININMEDALGLSTSTFAFRGEAEYNIGSRRRSHVRMSYFGLIRNSNKTLETEVEIGNSVFPIGTELSSKFNLHIIRGLYDYAFFKDERISLGVSGGLYVLPVKFAIATESTIDESTSFVAPLPVIGVRNTFLITPKIAIKQSVEVLYIKISNYQGSISDLNIWLEYNPFKHLGIGLGYNTFQLNFNSIQSTENDRNFYGSIETGYTGLLFYGRYFF
ncbi:MAG: hypothetical protein KAI08_18005 [Bacteroidales bacterium]|nr:hypothetical protein [Bacteroidales bacterium]